MKSLIAGGVAALITIFTFTMVLSMQFSSNLTNDTREFVDEAVYTTQLVLLEDEGFIESDEDYIDVLRTNIRTQTSKKDNIDFSLNIYDADYKKGLLDVELIAKYKNILGSEKTIVERKTSIIDEIVK